MQHESVSDEQAERLLCAAEEMGEAIQAISKVLRHGWDSRNPHKVPSPTNKTALTREMAHVSYWMGELMFNGDLDFKHFQDAHLVKAKEAPQYMHHQKKENKS